uniref:ornithine decarboxylase n=1 Tax=Acrobeloides nanus TaxID=290746 RepID=A0A914ENS6_9BILA
MDSYKIKDFHCDKIFVFDKPVGLKFAGQRIAEEKNKSKDDDSFAIVDLKVIADRFNEWKSYLPRVEPYYAVKCNDDLVILRTIANLGYGFECASKGEIDLILDNKLSSAEKIVYSHTIKTPSYLDHASKIGVKLMTFDNEEELEKIKEFHQNPELILRTLPNGPNATFGKKFGCDPVEEGPKLLEKAFEMGLTVVGISFHIGSANHNDICQAIKDAKNLFDFGTKIGHKMKLLDIGGGFPGYDEVGKLPFTKIASIIKPVLDEYFPESMGVKIISEPGKYFVASAVSVVVNIIASTKVKASRMIENPPNPNSEAYMYYVNDGHFGSFAGRLFENYRPIGEPLFDPKEPQKEYPCIIYGPTCDGKDKIE